MYELKAEFQSKDIVDVYTYFIKELRLIDAVSSINGEIYDNISVEERSICFREKYKNCYSEITFGELFEVFIFIQENDFDVNALRLNNFSPHTEYPLIAFLVATNLTKKVIAN